MAWLGLLGVHALTSPLGPPRPEPLNVLGPPGLDVERRRDTSLETKVIECNKQHSAPELTKECVERQFRFNEDTRSISPSRPDWIESEHPCYYAEALGTPDCESMQRDFVAELFGENPTLPGPTRPTNQQTSPEERRRVGSLIKQRCRTADVVQSDPISEPASWDSTRPFYYSTTRIRPKRSKGFKEGFKLRAHLLFAPVTWRVLLFNANGAQTEQEPTAFVPMDEATRHAMMFSLGVIEMDQVWDTNLLSDHSESPRLNFRARHDSLGPRETLVKPIEPMPKKGGENDDTGRRLDDQELKERLWGKGGGVTRRIRCDLSRLFAATSPSTGKKDTTVATEEQEKGVKLSAGLFFDDAQPKNLLGNNTAHMVLTFKSATRNENISGTKTFMPFRWSKEPCVSMLLVDGQLYHDPTDGREFTVSWVDSQLKRNQQAKAGHVLSATTHVYLSAKDKQKLQLVATAVKTAAFEGGGGDKKESHTDAVLDTLFSAATTATMGAYNSRVELQGGGKGVQNTQGAVSALADSDVEAVKTQGMAAVQWGPKAVACGVGIGSSLAGLGVTAGLGFMACAPLVLSMIRTGGDAVIHRVSNERIQISQNLTTQVNFAKKWAEELESHVAAGDANSQTLSEQTLREINCVVQNVAKHVETAAGAGEKSTATEERLADEEKAALLLTGLRDRMVSTLQTTQLQNLDEQSQKVDANREEIKEIHTDLTRGMENLGIMLKTMFDALDLNHGEARKKFNAALGQVFPGWSRDEAPSYDAMVRGDLREVKNFRSRNEVIL